MPHFIFKLETVLDLRRQAEKEQQRAVAKIQQQIEHLRRQIQQTQQAISQQHRALSADKLIGRLDLSYITHEKRFVGNLQLLLVQTFQQLVAREQEMVGARAKLLEAAKARKVIEKLREKQFFRWRQEQDRKESAQLDELGTQVALRGLLVED